MTETTTEKSLADLSLICTDKAFHQAEELFKGLEPTHPMWNIEGRRMERKATLPDQTVILMVKPETGKYEVTISGPLDDQKKGDRRFQFVLTQEGLISFESWYIDVKIGDNTVKNLFLSLKLGISDSSLSEDQRRSFRENAQPLVDWVAKMIDKKSYTPPPYTIYPH
jgi:hypothetical protein